MMVKLDNGAKVSPALVHQNYMFAIVTRHTVPVSPALWVFSVFPSR